MCSALAYVCFGQIATSQRRLWFYSVRAEADRRKAQGAAQGRPHACCAPPSQNFYEILSSRDRVGSPYGRLQCPRSFHAVATLNNFLAKFHKTMLGGCLRPFAIPVWHRLRYPRETAWSRAIHIISLVRVVVANWRLRTHAKVPQLDQPLTFSSAKTAGIFIHLNDELLNTLAEGVIR